ncbi:hypothetical protein ES705_25130 [subsurface metagenome]
MAASHKNRIVTFLILIILQTGVLSQLLSGQEHINIDSLENELAEAADTAQIWIMLDLCDAYLDSSLERSDDYAHDALSKSRQIGYATGEADALNRIGNIYYSTSNFTKAMEYYFESLEIRENIQDSIGIAVCYNNLGIIASEFNDNNMAIEYTQKAIKINTKLNYTYGIIDNYINMGVYYDELGETSKALNYYFMNL